jgi:hypothetical protein
MPLGGDWVDGPVRWWWKYVFPVKDVFYANLLPRLKVGKVAGPQPEPWRQVAGELLETSAMVHALDSISDSATKSKLQTEAAAKLQAISKQLSAHQT